MVNMIHPGSLLRLHLLLAVAGMLAALMLQIASGPPLWIELGPLSVAQALLLGLLSVPCLMLSRWFGGRRRISVVWGAAAATLATVGIIQLAILMLGALPESPALEYPAMTAWCAAAATLSLTWRLGQPSGRGRAFVLAGFALQSVALAADFADGGGLGLGLGLSWLRLLGVAEEVIEMLVLVCYLAGVTNMAIAASPASARARPVPAPADVQPRPPEAAFPARVRALAPFEIWPPWLFYAPVAAYVVWRGLRSGGIALPAAVNPALAGDGILNVPKCALFRSMRPPARRWLPRYLLIERTPGDGPRALREVLARIERSDLRFPMVAKPDRGGRGAGVKLLQNDGDLRRYLALIPTSSAFLLQEFVPLELEAGVMYVRHPQEREGRIVGMALKESPVVTGDGEHTVRALIADHPRATHLRDQALRENREVLDRILPRGERLELIFARNHCRGAIFRDGTSLVTAALERRIDEIAQSIPSFHLGRFDIRFASVPRLQEGEDFRVIEVNGAVSEPIHAWDPGNTVIEAWRRYFDQIDRLYAAAAASSAIGHRGPGLPELIGGWWRLHRISRTYSGQS